MHPVLTQHETFWFMRPSFFRLALSELIMINGVDGVAETALGELMDKARQRRPRTPTKTSTLIITGVTRVREYDMSDSD